MANVGGDRPTVRWRGPSTECKFCHANPHERAIGRPRRSRTRGRRHRPAMPAVRALLAPSGRRLRRCVSTADARPLRVAVRSFTDAVHAARATRRRLAADAAGGSKFDHSTTGFPLTGEHIHTPCVALPQQHARPSSASARAATRTSTAGGCSQTCDTCHSPAGWKVTRPLEIHRMTRFPLTGMHVLADCTECHLRASEQKWTDAPIDCFACHEKDYRGPATSRCTWGRRRRPPLPRDCSLCHRAIAWVPANVPGSTLWSLGSPLQAQAAPAQSRRASSRSRSAPPDGELRATATRRSPSRARCAASAATRTIRCS